VYGGKTRKVDFRLRVQELSDIAAAKASGAKDSVSGTSKDVYDSVADRLTAAHKTATQQLADTRKAAEQQWSGAHTAWQKATGQHRTTSQKAWDKAQVCTSSLCFLCPQCTLCCWLQGRNELSGRLWAG
jgi:ribosomal protein L4